MDQRTLDERRLASEAGRYALARAQVTRTRETLKATVRALHSLGGWSEVDLAQRAGVDRQTLRAWLGKQPSNRKGK